MSDPNTLSERIPETAAGLRLDQVLAQMFPQYSRSVLQGLIRDGRIRVDDEIRRPRDKVFGGERVELDPPADAGTAWLPEPMPLSFAYRDPDLMIVDKPAGLVVHPGAGNQAGTLVNGLLACDEALAALPRAGLVHRLDKDTSGLLVVARNRPVFDALTKAMSERRISRSYLALCVGALTGGGTIDEPIARHPVERTKMAVVSGGRDSVTHYRIARRFRGYTLLDVQLETGRTHQIRVHLSHRGYPLVGDPVYGRLAIPRGAGVHLLEQLRGFRRQALHAYSLALTHPVTGDPVAAESPLPADFEALLAALADDPSQAFEA